MEGEATMNWDEFNDVSGVSKDKLRRDGQIPTDIVCPVCAKETVFWDAHVMLLSYPEKFRYWCPCGWSGFSFKKWTSEE